MGLLYVGGLGLSDLLDLSLMACPRSCCALCSFSSLCSLSPAPASAGTCALRSCPGSGSSSSGPGSCPPVGGIGSSSCCCAIARSRFLRAVIAVGGVDGIDINDADDVENEGIRVLLMKMDRENDDGRDGADDDDDDGRDGGVARFTCLSLASPILNVVSICRLVLFNSSSCLLNLASSSVASSIMWFMVSAIVLSLNMNSVCSVYLSAATPLIFMLNLSNA